MTNEIPRSPVGQLRDPVLFEARQAALKGALNVEVQKFARRAEVTEDSVEIEDGIHSYSLRANEGLCRRSIPLGNLLGAVHENPELRKTIAQGLPRDHCVVQFAAEHGCSPADVILWAIEQGTISRPGPRNDGGGCLDLPLL